MAIKTDTYSSAGGGAGSDTLDDVTTRGATTTNAITVGGVSVGTEYSLPTADGSADQVLKTDGNGSLSFTTINVTGGLQYIGTFNATTGLPSLANAQKGDYYKIATEGTIYGKTWDVNDSLLINEDMGGTITNSKIDKIDNTEPTNVLITTNNLSDLDNASTARTNLGLGTAATSASTDFLQVSNNLSDLNNVATARTNLGLGSAATSASTDFLQVSNNLSDLNNASTARTNLGLGTAATEDHGTATGDLVILENVGGVAGLPAVDGSQLINITATSSDTLDDVTTRGATTTNAITVGGVTTSGDILADADASRTIGAEATRFITYHGDMNGAIRFKAKNNQGSAITKGQVVYISGVSGTVPEVKLAQANSASTMPAFGLALANANDQAEVQVITFGNLTDYNTTTYSLSANDTVFVSATTAGALTNSAPTGESNLIQNIGRVVRADASAGIIKVGGAGRSNATPNLDQDKVFLGNASNQSVSTALSAIGLSKFNNDSNFLTNINSESLNDLSDVSYTAGSGIDNYVLTYDHSTTSWGAEAPASGGYPVQTATSSITANLNSAVYLTAGSATACTVTLPATSGATDGDAVIIVRRSPGSLTIQQNGADSGTLVTYLDQGNASSHTITNNQQQIHVRYDSSGTRWYIYDRAQALVATTGDYDDLSNLPTLGTASALDVGTSGSNVVQLNGSAQLPAVDGSNLTNVGKFIDYTVASSSLNVFKNRGYQLAADSLTLTLPARSTLSDGDYLAITSASSYSCTIALNSADSGTSNIFYNVGTGTHSTTSHTITINKQEIFVRFNGSSFLITSETKGGIASVSADTAPSLGGNLDVNGNDIVSASNGDIEIAPDGTGSTIIKGNGTGGSGHIVLNCENNSHGITLKGPPHSASATYELVFPTGVGTDGQVLKTDGGDGGSPNSVQLAWVDQAGGGGSAPTVTSASVSGTYPSSGDLASSGIEQIYILNPTANTTVNLAPSANCGSGFKYQIKNLGAYTLTITPDSTASEYIDFSTQTTFDIVQYESVTLVSDGSNNRWFII